MAAIKVFDTNGVKEIVCFDTLQDVPYIIEEEEVDDTPEEQNPFA